MRIAVPLRDDENTTNKRNRCLGRGMAALGHDVRHVRRSDNLRGYDLVLHTGFSGTRSLISAIQYGIPYIICEAPTWRGRDREVAESTMISWTYGGLLGGGFHNKAPTNSRPHPKLQPMKTEGATIIFGQKPTDHSLRGHDHVKWIEEQKAAYPFAEFRHHPTMVRGQHTRENIVDTLDRCHAAVTYTSTVGVEAKIAGCISYPSHVGSAAHTMLDREEWIHELSWWNCTMKEAEGPEIATHILNGYDEAYAMAQKHEVEIPRLQLKSDAMHDYLMRFGNE